MENKNNMFSSPEDADGIEDITGEQDLAAVKDKNTPIGIGNEHMSVEDTLGLPAGVKDKNTPIG